MHGGTSFYFYLAVVALIGPVRVFHMKNILTSILLFHLLLENESYDNLQIKALPWSQ
ncbi:uncharacterized protein K489DRAFT_377427 [Dissoconium aciculare CBS 342.82]|uniref:Uncharacterized protein n=1 Tax=Dissoconium aciculare CBS 342.82 TaxID=1314786 RepID=A0A6J3MB77_9PEZI|nr:uncharacterized protein K489DRAFT_377427 [Dissoconium aciculare CBS 342.82]KAF1824889.1 hypothetical protein K489DRAFT_377427 [Dissoconium aciculare CBS 342.82]